MPVAISARPWPSRSSLKRISVSRVFRSISEVRWSAQRAHPGDAGFSVGRRNIGPVRDGRCTYGKPASISVLNHGNTGHVPFRATSGTRTQDPSFTKAVLYRLS